MKNKVILQIKISASNDHAEEAMEKMLQALHRLLPQNVNVSLELVCENQFITFYIVIDSAYASLVESQLYSQFPESEVEEKEEYLPATDNNLVVEQINFRHASFTSFKTYHDLEESYHKAFFAVLSKIAPTDRVFMQFALKKVGSKIYERGIKGVRYSFSGKSSEKFSKDLYLGKLRIAYQSETKQRAKEKLEPLLNLLKSVKGENELKKKKFFAPKNIYQLFQKRSTEKGDFWTAEELATLYHFPTKNDAIVHVVHTNSKRAPAPDILPLKGQFRPDKLSLIAETNFRNEKHIFGMLEEDRRRHMYVIGKTGVGKSKFLELLMTSDIENNKGFCLLDPHGDLAQAVLQRIPKNRIKDVVYIDPANRDFPIAFNPLEYTKDYEKRQHLAFFFIAIFKKLMSVDWNDRMEHILRFIILALLETPDANILGIARILSDTTYRHRVITQVQDPVVKQFWANEFSSWSEQYANQAIVPILNKVGQFISNPLIRNMIGQQKNMLNFEKFMNTNKMVIINISKGKLGEENASLLGSMFITKIQQAAMQRASMREEDRKDFYFYIDEFQNFATDAFQSILSESRKYRLNLTIAHQYINQLDDSMKASIFGNVASLFVFAVGGDDAAYLAKEFTPTFSADDIINLEAREMYVRTSINGRTSRPFSARTLTIPTPQFNFIPDIISHTQTIYATNRVGVESEIEKWVKSKNNYSNEKINDEKKFPEPII